MVFLEYAKKIVDFVLNLLVNTRQQQKSSWHTFLVTMIFLVYDFNQFNYLMNLARAMRKAVCFEVSLAD